MTSVSLPTIEENVPPLNRGSPKQPECEKRAVGKFEKTAAWRTRLLEPVLNSTADRLLHPPGAPPRRPVSAHDSSINASAPALSKPLGDDELKHRPSLSTASTALLSTASTGFESSNMFASGALSLSTRQQTAPTTCRRPRLPRMAYRRVWSQQGMLAVTDSSRAASEASAPSKVRRPNTTHLPPPSAIEVSEAIHLRECSRKNASVWRGTLDRQVHGRDDEQAEMARYRQDCNRARGSTTREQATAWREKQHWKSAVTELRWNLEHYADLSHPFELAAPVEGDAANWQRGRDSVASLHELPPLRALEAADWPHHPPVRIPTPTGQAAKWRRQQRAVQSGDVDEDTGEANAEDTSGSESDSGRLHLREVLERCQRSILKKCKLRSKQSLHARHKLMRVRRRGQLSSKQELNGHVQAALGRKDEQLLLEGMVLKRKLSADPREPTQMKEAGAEMSRKELQTVKAAFKDFDCDGSGSLDQSELKNCLAALGLKAKNEQEREAIKTCLRQLAGLEVSFDEFALQIVPCVRKKLAAMKSDGLKDLFREHDADNSGSLSIAETIKILRLHGIFPNEDRVLDVIGAVMPELMEEVTTMDGSVLLNRNVLDLGRFQRFMQLLEESTLYERSRRKFEIVKDEAIDDAQAELWKHSIVDIHESFLRHCSPADSGLLASSKALKVIQDIGLMPKIAQVRSALPAFIAEVGDNTENMLHFRDFVQVLTKMRSETADYLQSIFEKYDANHSGGLSLTEAQAALQDSGVRTRNKEETDEVYALIQEFDEDGSGEVDEEEFVGLALFVAERLEKIRREAERQLVVKFGWSLRQYEEFRNVFLQFDTDMSEMLESHEVGQVLHALRRGNGQEDTAVFHEFGLYDHGAKVDFYTFLKIMKAVDDREHVRILGAKLGLQTDTVRGMRSIWRIMEPNEVDVVPRDQLQNKLGGLLASNLPSALEAMNVELAELPLQVDFEAMVKLMMVVDPEGRMQRLSKLKNLVY